MTTISAVPDIAHSIGNWEQLPDAFRACIRLIRADQASANLQIDPHKWTDLRALLVLSGAVHAPAADPDHFTSADGRLWICNKRAISPLALLRHLKQ